MTIFVTLLSYPVILSETRALASYLLTVILSVVPTIPLTVILSVVPTIPLTVILSVVRVDTSTKSKDLVSGTDCRWQLRGKR